jgi:hypothetical protein
MDDYPTDNILRGVSGHISAFYPFFFIVIGRKRVDSEAA